jgi:hypothetical protein
MVGSPDLHHRNVYGGSDMNNAQWLILMFMMEMGLPVAAAIEIVQVVCTLRQNKVRFFMHYLFSFRREKM